MRVRLIISAALGFLAAGLSLPPQARAQLGLPARAPSADSAPSSVSPASPRGALQSFLRLAEARENLPNGSCFGDEGDQLDVTATVRALERKLLPRPGQELGLVRREVSCERGF